jgi:solute carrier family 25 2-oxodicarboxylate transporter 21
MSKTDCMHIASSFSGIIEVAVSHPLDRIKTEMQIMTLNNSKSNVLTGIKHIYQNNGIRGFYSGIFPRFVGIVPMRLMYWSSMTIASDYINHNKEHFEFHTNKYVSYNTSNFLINLIPGLVTGLAQSIIDNPIEVAKIKIMSGSSDIKISNLYQGFGYLLTRNILFAIPVAYSIKTYGKENPFLAGAFGGLIGSIISHPFDVIKTERQRHKNVKDDVKINNKKITLSQMIIKNPFGLFSGLTMRCSLSFINMGVGFVVFNHLYKGLYKFVNDEHLD